MRLTVRAPATVANLGPGFDSLALALDLWNEFSVDTEADPGVEIDGEGAGELGSAEDNLVVRTIRERFAGRGDPVPAFALRCVTRVPLRRGLGSSTTAAVAGAMLAAALAGERVGPDDVLAVAAAADGHADNAAACVLGGLTIAYADAGGRRWHAARADQHPDLRPVVLIPLDEEVATAAGRAALPGEVRLADAVFNLSHAALVVHALTRRPDLIGEALADRLHQAHRLALAPRAAEMFGRLVAAGLPVCVAGSGPSLLAFEEAGRRIPDPAEGWRVLRPAVTPAGAVLERDD